MKKYILMLLLILMTVTTALAGDKVGTFVKVTEKAKGSFEEVSASVEAALKNAGWDILAVYDNGVPEGCNFQSRTIVFSSKTYADSVMAQGVTSSFALPLRAGIYEDESGINVAFINPVSINRTIIGETILHDLSASTSKALAETISIAAPGEIVKQQIGQMRTKGKVGGMGGGKFLNKIEEIHKAADDSEETFRKVAAAVNTGIEGNKKGWKRIYTYDLSEHGVIIYGIAQSATEGKAFIIAGGKRASKSYQFPGLDHGAAFPIEVIVYKEGGTVKVVTLDEMYRMKLYFEDAGMWAFMKNMSMPGQIEKEVIEIAGSEFDN